MRTLNLINAAWTLLLSIVISGCSGPSQKHIGEWKGYDSRGDANFLTFNSDGSAVWIGKNQKLGGKHFQIQGTEATMNYEVDYSKDPIWLDLVVQKSGEFKEFARIKGIIRFISDTKMEYRLSTEGRFSEFDSRDIDNTMMLEKVE